MMMPGELVLIAEDPEAHGAFGEHEKVERTVFCTVKSVGRTEMYAALSSGHEPSYIFHLDFAFEYQGEKLCRYDGIEYRIIRTYAGEVDGIDLTVERSNHYVSGTDGCS